MRTIVLLSIFAFATPVLAGAMPAMRPGMWEFTRKAPMDPFANPGQLSTMSTKECIRDMKTVNGDSAYESRIETEGTAAGKHAKWTETLSAKRIGECGQ